MSIDNLNTALRFYFISDDQATSLTPYDQVRIAIQAGATTIQYRRKKFNLQFYDEALAIRQLCQANAVPFIVNDHVLLARALAAEGVHLGQADANPGLVRRILGPQAIIGISVSNRYELTHTDLTPCDYIGSGPVFPTTTKADAKKVRQLSGLEEITRAAPLPVVAIGGIDHTNATACFQYGATGIAVISTISRATDPLQNALQLSAACGCIPRDPLGLPPSEAI
ncbi:thiamine phosphate synthase [Thermodesulfobacteriota bacterium]